MCHMVSDLLLVRHGICTGNFADRASSKGDHSYFTHTVTSCHSDLWPLIDEGRHQSKRAGDKVRELVPDVDLLLCSGVPRATQTADHMGLVGVERRSDPLLRERNWAGLENLPYNTRNEIFAQAGVSPVENSMNWAPPGGETMNSLVQRMSFFLHRISLMHAHKKVVAVMHGGPIQAMRVLQHEIREGDYVAFISGNNYIRNCQIIHYSDVVAGRFTSERLMYMDSQGRWVEFSHRLGTG